jgi:hypothetical protein
VAPLKINENNTVSDEFEVFYSNGAVEVDEQFNFVFSNNIVIYEPGVTLSF